MIAEAKRARAVLVLERAAAGGALKTARKGVGEFKITVHGCSAHAGVNPAAGANAIIELTRQLLTVQSFARPRRGLTITWGELKAVPGPTLWRSAPRRGSTCAFRGCMTGR